MMIKSTRTASFREQLRGFTAVELPLADAAGLLSQNLQRFGPVVSEPLMGVHAALAYLNPLKSFTTRFVVMECGQWVVILTDMKGSYCSTYGYALSRATGCKAFGLVALPERREIQIFSQGEKLREVDSSLDFDYWYYREVGEMQWFEDDSEYTKRRKRDRLSETAVVRYFERYTGMPFPDWQTFSSCHAVGLERSLKDLQVPVSLYETDVQMD